MRTDIHPKDPKAARSLINRHACGRTHTPFKSIGNTIVNYLKSVKYVTPAKSDPVPAMGRIFY